MISKISAAQLIPENLLLYELENGPSIFQVEIDPIDYCNHNCKWCFTENFRKDKKIALIDLKKYLLAFCKSGGKSVVFSGGGEPLLYKEIFNKSNIFDNKSICKYLIENSIYIGIITNGLLLQNLLLSDFDVNNLCFIRISLDATNKVSHSMLHKTSQADFCKILNSINSLVEHRGRSYMPAIGISFVVDAANGVSFHKEQIECINKLATELEVDFVQFKHINTNRREMANENMRTVHSHCLEMDWGNVEFWVQTYDFVNSSENCLITQYIQSIGNDSKKFPCCHLFGRTKSLDQTVFLPKGTIINNCSNRVCRYNEMNNLLLNNFSSKKEVYKLALNDSLNRFGFHPYRYCPTAPNIMKPFKSL